MLKLGYESSSLDALNGSWTATEIIQQPGTLTETARRAREMQAEIAEFAAPVLDDTEGLLILTGAGSSAFIGEILEALLVPTSRCRVHAIATTDIVADPAVTLDPKRPTLLVSFARSGNSPESIAAVDLADQLLPGVRHLAITCNAQGELARRFAAGGNRRAVILPDETHDRGFAMTSSLSAMTLAALTLLTDPRRPYPGAEMISAMMERTIDDECASLSDIASLDCNRVVYLGSGPFKGVARESALKLLELTNGATVALHDTPLGFRHGPKTIVNPETLVVVFVSNNEYTRGYDLDVIAELRSDGLARRVMAVSGRADDRLDSALDIVIAGGHDATDAELVFPYLAIAQMLSFHESLRRGVTPDNPSPSGMVNRVVQGVTIYPFIPAASA